MAPVADRPPRRRRQSETIGRTLIEVDRTRERVVGLFSRAAPTYDSVGPRHFSYFADSLVEFVGLDEEGDVLDVATGAGAVLLAAAKRVGAEGRVVGIDLTPAMLARAAAEIERHSLADVELRLMDGERLVFLAASFDSVLCSLASRRSLIRKRHWPVSIACCEPAADSGLPSRSGGRSTATRAGAGRPTCSAASTARWKPTSL
jgi:SAM-dependent methyltransferase